MKYVGCMIGHSFVAGLHRHLLNGHNKFNRHVRATRPRATSVHQIIAKQLRLGEVINPLHMMGVNGAKICNKEYNLLLQRLSKIKPDFIVINLNTNDLAAEKTAIRGNCQVDGVLSEFAGRTAVAKAGRRIFGYTQEQSYEMK